MIPSRKPPKKRKGRYKRRPVAQLPPQPPGLANVKLMRVDRGWGRDELAKRSGVKERTIRAIEQGEVIDPKLSTMRMLAAAFSVSVGELVGIENPYGDEE